MDQLMRDIPADRMAWWSASGNLPEQAAGRVGRYKSGGLPPRLEPQRRLREIKTALIRHFWLPSAANGLRRFIAKEKPDLLWLVPHTWSIPVLHRTVMDLGIPWHISVHDFPYPPPSPRSWLASFQGMLDDLYAGASSRDVIGPEMAGDLEQRTGRKTDTFFRCSVEPEEFEHVRNKTLAPICDKIIIGYPGTILAEDTFARFIAALDLIREKLPLPVEVHLFTAHSYRDRAWYDPSLIFEQGFLYGEDLERAYRRCNWGLAIMPLKETNPRYSRFSFPCKFTRPLASGLPIICLGHPESSLIRLAIHYQLGPVLSLTEPAQIASALLSALSDLEASPRVRSEILRCAENEFNAERNRRRLKEAFLTALSKP